MSPQLQSEVENSGSSPSPIKGLTSYGITAMIQARGAPELPLRFLQTELFLRSSAKLSRRLRAHIGGASVGTAVLFAVRLGLAQCLGLDGPAGAGP